jgi:coenzyme F420-reducing hydrogenase delta subunit
VEPNRVTFSWVSASEGNKWQELVNETTERVKALGPFREFQDMTQKGEACQ